MKNTIEVELLFMQLLLLHFLNVFIYYFYYFVYYHSALCKKKYSVYKSISS